MSRTDIMAFIGANAQGFFDAMRRVRSDTKNTADKAQRDFSGLSSGINRSLGMVKGALAVAGVGFGIQGITQTISEFADLDREAKRAGVSVRAFQELKFVGERNRIDVDAMVDGIKELSLRTDEYLQNAGKSGVAAESFKRLGFTVDEVAVKLQDPSALFTEIIGKLQKLDRAAQIRIADELFGGSAGERFVQLVDQGAEGIRETIEEGHRLGVIIDEELIRKATELDQAFNTIVTTVGSNLKQAIVTAADELRYFIDLLNDVDDRSISTLEQQLTTKREQLAKTDRSTIARFIVNGSDDGGIDRLKAEIAEMEKVIADRKAAVEEKPIKLAPITIGSGDTGGSRKPKITEAEREKKAIEELIEALETEAAVAGLSDEKRDIEVALRKAGSAATADQKEKIESLIEARYREEKALQAVEDQQKRNADAAEDFADIAMDGIDEIIDGTYSAEKALSGLAKSMARALLTGQGPFANLFGTTSATSGLGGLFSMFFGGPKAAGGPVSPGSFYQVNEKGQEFFSPGTHGSIIPAGRGGSGAGSGGAPIFNIDARGSEAGVEQKIKDAVSEALDQYDRGNTARVAQGYSEAARRNMI